MSPTDFPFLFSGVAVQRHQQHRIGHKQSGELGFARLPAQGHQPDGGDEGVAGQDTAAAPTEESRTTPSAAAAATAAAANPRGTEAQQGLFPQGQGEDAVYAAVRRKRHQPQDEEYTER